MHFFLLNQVYFSQDCGTIDLTNFEEEHATNNIDDDQFSVKREGALNKSLDAGFGTYDPAISGYLDPDEVLQDLEDMEKLEESSIEAGLRYTFVLAASINK